MLDGQMNTTFWWAFPIHFYVFQRWSKGQTKLVGSRIWPAGHLLRTPVIAENVPISGIPILIFLCIFITASYPRCHIPIFAPGEKIKSNLEVKLCKMCLRGQGQSAESGKYTHVKMGTTPLILKFESNQTVFKKLQFTDSLYFTVLCQYTD